MPTRISTHATLRVDQPFNFNNFSQDNLVSTRPVSQLRPFLANNGRASYRLSNQSRTSSTYSTSTSSGPLTPRNQTESPDFATAPSVASSELEPHAISEESPSMYSAQTKMATPVMHPRFNRMSMWVAKPGETDVQEELPLVVETPSSASSSEHDVRTPTADAIEEAEDLEDFGVVIEESPQIYHVLELENDLIEDMVSLRLAKPSRPHKAETVVFSRPKTLMIPPSPTLKKPIPVSTPKPVSKPRPKLNTVFTAPILPTTTTPTSSSVCPVHGSKHKSTIIPVSLPTTPVSATQKSLPSPIPPSKLRNSLAADSMRKSVAISIKSFDEIRKSKHFSSVPKVDQSPKVENRKSFARRKFSFEEDREEPTPALPVMVSTSTKTTTEKKTSEPAKVVEAPVSASISTQKEEIVKKLLGPPIRSQTVPAIPLADVTKTSTNRESFESFKLDLTLSLPTSEKPLPSPTKAPCPVHGQTSRPSSTWTTKPPVIVPPKIPAPPPRSSSISISIPKDLKSNETQSHDGTKAREVSAGPVDLVSPSLQFLREDPFNSRLSFDLQQQKTRPKSSSGDSTHDNFDPVFNRTASSKAPSIKSTRSTRSMKNGLSKMRSIFTRRKTMDLHAV